VLPIIKLNIVKRFVVFLALAFGMAGEGSLVWSDIDRPLADKGPTKVRVTTFILDVDEINSAEQNFTVSLYHEYRWRDPRLVHEESGAVSRGPREIWYPPVKIVNQQRVWPTFDRIAKVFPDGEVVARQRLWGDFSQPLNLVEFPFDRHTFEIQITASGYTPKEVKFVKDPDHRTGIAETLSVADWRIDNFQARAVPYEPIKGDQKMSGFLISFDGERRSSHYMIKVIIPLILIVAMSWVVFWIDPKEGGSQIGVALTTMLTLIAYRFAVGSELPNIPYLTRMDYFLLASTVLVFASLIEVTITAYYARADRVDRALRIDRWARWLFVGTFIFFMLYALVF
jgi:hypothetical protein